MSVEDLRQRVRSVLGVASAEVTMGPNEEPLVRVSTDGTRSEADVQKAIEPQWRSTPSASTTR